MSLEYGCYAVRVRQSTVLATVYYQPQNRCRHVAQDADDLGIFGRRFAQEDSTGPLGNRCDAAPDLITWQDVVGGGVSTCVDARTKTGDFTPPPKLVGLRWALGGDL